jgi:hypothetical protein
MAGFVPGRDRVTLEALSPEETERRDAVEATEHRAVLDKEELAQLERLPSSRTSPKRKRGLLDRLFRRR